MKYVLTLTVLLIAGGCAQPTDVLVEPKPTGSLSGKVIEEPIVLGVQKAGNKITIDSLEVSDPSFVIIRDLPDGKLGTIIGTSGLLTVGEQRMVVVTLNKSYPAETRLEVYIHKDDGDKKFDSTKDFPVLNEKFEPVKMEILLTE